MKQDDNDHTYMYMSQLSAKIDYTTVVPSFATKLRSAHA